MSKRFFGSQLGIVAFAPLFVIGAILLLVFTFKSYKEEAKVNPKTDVLSESEEQKDEDRPEDSKTQGSVNVQTRVRVEVGGDEEGVEDDENEIDDEDEAEVEDEIEDELENEVEEEEREIIDEQKLLGLFRVAIERRVRVSAQNGEVVGINQSLLSRILDILSI